MQVSYTHELPMGHRLMDHDGNCKYAHGHNYLVTVSLSGDFDVKTGMVVDFGALKKAVRAVLEPYDHAFVVQAGDPLEPALKPYAKVIRMIQPPTAEMLALRWHDEIEQQLPGLLAVQGDGKSRLILDIEVRETRDCTVVL